MRSFVRGFFVDPELEKKAHETLSEANQAAKSVKRAANGMTLLQWAALGAVTITATAVILSIDKEKQDK